MFIRPGHSIREYLEGKRIKHIQPLSFILILAGFYILLCHWFHLNLFTLSNEAGSKIHVDHNSVKLDEFMLKNFGWLTPATIPFYTVGTYLCFYKSGYNFVEYLILNTFKAGQRLILQILFLPFIFLIKHSLSIGTVVLITYLLDLGLNFWTNIQFFKHLSPINIILRSFVSHAILIIILLSVVALFMAIGILS